MKRSLPPSFLAFVWGIGMLISMPHRGNAQSNTQPSYQDGRYTHLKSAHQLQNGRTLSVVLPTLLGIPNRVQAASVRVRLDLGNDYAYGNVSFRARVKFRLQGVKGNATLPMCVQNCALETSRSAPEALYAQDFRLLSNGLQTFQVNQAIIDSFRVTIDSVLVSVDPIMVGGIPQQATLQASLANDLRVTLEYAIDYGIDAGTVALNALTANQLANSKVVSFAWQASNVHPPNYQFQLLRLYNLSLPESDTLLRGQIQRDEAILTQADWSKALTIETQSSRNRFPLTVAEGTGYYAWRVRPIGTYEPGGIANAANFGVWSATTALTPGTPLRRADLPIAGIFYFVDPDDQKNTIYSRTFTEGNRMSEKISYASQLQQLKQTQTYLPSKKTRIISQTIYDHSNRPALATLPVPVADTIGLRGYRNLFVKSQKTDSLYRAKDFDARTNYRSPAPVKQTNTDFAYYGGSNHIPSSEGYPITRSLYYSDGTNRVKEQSGVGRTHMIGDSTGMGRTVKTLYSTASDPELIRLFGDEAPAAESVLKTATIDQNNTASITYTSKEGKVIATALAFQDQSPNLLPLDGASSGSDPIKDVIQSQADNKGFVGSKRLSVVAPTPLNIAYKMDTCTSVTGDCVKTQLTCAFDLWVVVRKVDGQDFSTRSGSAHYVNLGSNGKPWAFLPWGVKPGVDSSAVYSRDTTVSCTQNSSLVFSTLTVPTGSYIIEKKLLLRRQQARVEAAQDQLDAQTKPLIDLITGWTDQVTCSKEVEVFYERLRKLSRSLDSVRTLCNTSPANCKMHFKNLDQYYKTRGLAFSDSAFFNADHRIVVSPAVGKPQYLSISAACCQNIQIPITFALPAFNFKDIALRDQNGDGLIKVNPFHGLDARKTEFFPDFEGYAYGYYWDCTPKGAALAGAVAGVSIPATMYPGDTTVFYQQTGLSPSAKISMLTEAQNKVKYIYEYFLKPTMNGWQTPGTLNLMVHHMLTDSYTADGKDAAGNTVPERPVSQLDECTGAITNPCHTGTCVQYTAPDLFRCWVNQLAYMKDLFRLCPNPVGASVGEEGEPPYKVSNTVDRENNGNQSKHDDHLTDNVSGGGWLLNWFIKRKVKNIARDVRNMQLDPLPPGSDESRRIRADYKYHLIEQYLGCTGYRFAKILTNAPQPTEAEPLASDKISGLTYTVPASSVLNPSWQTYGGQNRGYRPYGRWWAVVGVGNQADTLFKSVKDPVFAFKYFQYADWDMPEVEINTCYSDPNYYLAADGVTKVYLCPTSPQQLCNFCGIGRVRCSLTKEKWTAGQRYTFYEMINRYRKLTPINWRDEGLKAGDFSSPGYVNQNEFAAWSDNHPTVYTSNTYPQAAQAFGMGTANRLKAKVEMDISALNVQVARTCESKRSAFRKTLIDTLVARCYIIGGCKTSANDRIVPLEDIGFMVDAMVGECKLRGQTRTFRTTTDSCRYVYAPRSKKGHVDTLGVRIEYTTVEYGVGSPADANCQKAKLLYRPGFSSTPVAYQSANPNHDTLRAEPSEGTTPLVILECTGQTLTYEEYIRRKEVTEMVLRVSLPSKCANPPAFVCAPDPGNSFSGPTVKENSMPNTNNPVNPVYSGPPKKSTKVGLTVQVSPTNQVNVSKP